MDKEWKFTWEVEINGKVYTRKEHKSFDQFLHLRPFVFKVKEVAGNREFLFPVLVGQRPEFFRKVYGICGLNCMINRVVKIVNCFGVISDDKKVKNVVWECDNKYFFVDDIDKYVRLM